MFLFSHILVNLTRKLLTILWPFGMKISYRYCHQFIINNFYQGIDSIFRIEMISGKSENVYRIKLIKAMNKNKFRSSNLQVKKLQTCQTGQRLPGWIGDVICLQVQRSQG